MNSRTLGRIIVRSTLFVLASACASRAGHNAGGGSQFDCPKADPCVVSYPPPGATEYAVMLKPGLDTYAYAAIVSKRVNGKIRYIWPSYPGFTLYSIDEAAVRTILGMPEVVSVRKAVTGSLDHIARKG